MEIGALIGSEDKTVISRLAGIGRQLGLAFKSGTISWVSGVIKSRPENRPGGYPAPQKS
jgi:hypothetical protein